MSVRHALAAASLTAVVAALVTVPVAASNAAVPNDVFVETPGNGGDNANYPTCSQVAPCATVTAAIFAAATEGTTIHVGPGTFDEMLRPGALSKSLTIVGDSAATTTLTNSGLDGFVIEVGEDTTTLSNLTVHGGLASGVLVDGTGTVMADHVVLEHSACPLAVLSGTAQVTDSTIQGATTGDCNISAGPTPLNGDVAVAAGEVSLIRDRVLSPDTGTAGAAVQGGTLTADQSFFEDTAPGPNTSHAVELTAGTATVTRSTFHGYDTGVHNHGGTAFLTDDTFQGQPMGVFGESGSTTVVRSTFEGNVGAVSGTVALAGSVTSSTVVDCSAGTITDLGYNLSSDTSCGLSQSTSHENEAALNLDTALADRGGPAGLRTVATFWPSPAVDSIPAGATYGDSPTPLCTDTDLRGVPRPQGGACDAGSMELTGTTTTLTAPATAAPHTDVPLVATVAVPAVGVSGIESANGTVTFTFGAADTVLCQDVLVHLGEAACTSDALGAGTQTVRATFTPTVDVSTLHASTVTRTIKVGTKPAFTSRAKATFVVGKSQTFRVRASGSPSARITLVKGKLPAGLTFRAGTGSATISGKAKASGVGSHSVTVQATNLRGSVRQVIKVVVSRH